VSRPDACRFCRLYAASVPAFAAVIGAGTSLPYLLDRSHAGSHALILLSVLRSAAPMAAGSGLLLALVLWMDPLSRGGLAAELSRNLRRACAVAGPGYVVAVGVALTACFAVSAAVLGQTWGGFQGWLALLAPRDFGIGALATLLDTALIVLLARRYAIRLQSAGLSLPAKLIVVLTVTVPLRATVALILSSFLPG
jgi:hypothetical protein